MNEKNKVINELFVTLFNDILQIEVLFKQYNTNKKVK